MNISVIQRALPVRSERTPSGSDFIDGKLSTALSASPSASPASVAFSVMLRLRSTRVISAGPEPSETSATFISGTGPQAPRHGKQLEALEIRRATCR